MLPNSGAQSPAGSPRGFSHPRACLHAGTPSPQAQEAQRVLDGFTNAAAGLGQAKVHLGYRFMRLYGNGIILNPRDDVHVTYDGERVSTQEFVRRRGAAERLQQLRSSPSARGFFEALEIWSPVLLPNCSTGASVRTVIGGIAAETAAILALGLARLHYGLAECFSKPGVPQLLPRFVVELMLPLMKCTDLKAVWAACVGPRGGRPQNRLLVEKLLDLPQGLLLPTVGRIVSLLQQQYEGSPLTRKAVDGAIKSACPEDIYQVCLCLRGGNGSL